MHHSHLITCLSVFLANVVAIVAAPRTIAERQNTLPVLDLTYGKWRATYYDADADIYTFKNIRFAAPPTGDLRWAKPAPPRVETEVQTGEQGGSCYQSLPPGILYAALAGGLAPAAQGDGTFLGGLFAWIQSKAIPLLGGLVNDVPAFATVVSSLLRTQDIAPLMGGAPSSEDCLFLDFFVPGKALRGEIHNVPVINYIFGGAYIVGVKDGMYDGSYLVKQADGEVIVVVGNYRLGAFGFLGGETMIKENSAVPNAAFWDQRAVLEWIQKYVGLVNGDAGNVSLWGESAGAGSILHHLTAFGGTEPALFKKTVIQSPANVAQWDREGQVENQFKRFESLAGCEGKGIACLRKQSIDSLKKANDEVILEAPHGTFAFGPTVDGDFSRQLPDLELASGNSVKNVESFIITHTADEGVAFVSDSVNDDHTFFRKGVEYTWGSEPTIVSAILKVYPSPGPGSRFANEKERMVQFMTDHLFACKTRYLAQAFEDKTFMGQYSRGDGRHGRDIAATFYNTSKEAPIGDPTFPVFAAQYQNYLLAHVRTGDPASSNQTPVWPKVTMGDTMSNVMDAGNGGFHLVDDNVATADACDFWMDVMAAVTKKGGYTPPGGEVSSSLLTA